MTLSPGAEQRVLLGFAVQPFLTGLLGFILFPVVDYTGRPLYGGRPADSFDAARAFAFGVALAGTLVTAFAAFPVLMWLLKRGRPIGRTQVLVIGALLGNLPGMLIVGALANDGMRRTGSIPSLSDLTYGPAGAVRAVVLGSLIGVASTAVFWWLAGRHVHIGTAPHPPVHQRERMP